MVQREEKPRLQENVRRFLRRGHVEMGKKEGRAFGKKILLKRGEKVPRIRPQPQPNFKRSNAPPQEKRGEKDSTLMKIAGCPVSELDKKKTSGTSPKRMSER